LGKARGCVFGSSPKRLEWPHPELVQWWLLFHSSRLPPIGITKPSKEMAQLEANAKSTPSKDCLSPINKTTQSKEKAQLEATAKMTPSKDKGTTTIKTIASKDITLKETKSTPSKDITPGGNESNANQDLMLKKKS